MKARKRAARRAGTRSTKDLTAKGSGVKGGKERRDGSAAGNVAAKWNLAQGASA
jgi:hypothetical protein